MNSINCNQVNNVKLLFTTQVVNTAKYKDYFDYMTELGCPYFFDVLPLEALGL